MDRPTEKIARRFQNEKLAEHWKVDTTKESFFRMISHLEVKTNFKQYFDEALRHLDLDGNKFKKGLVVADIGAGVCWTSAILAQHPKVKLVYSVEPSSNRLEHAKFVINHYGVQDKVKIINGSFLKPNVPEKVDLILFCGSLHHCYEDQIDTLFLNIRNILNPKGVVLVANEHYVNWLWSLKRLLSYLKHFRKRKEIFYYSFHKLRAPHPFDGEHWRTKKEVAEIFRRHGLAKFFIHKGDLCKDKSSLYERLGWRYYHAILSCKS